MMIQDSVRLSAIAAPILLVGVMLVPFTHGREGPASGIWSQDSAERFAPGVISVETSGESWITFDPTGNHAVFGRHQNAGWNRHTIYESTRRAGRWGEPVIAPFSGLWEDRGARFSPDGRRLVFSSNRPRPGEPQQARRDFDLWVVERSDGRWAEPLLLAAPISSDAHDIHPSMASDGTLYFSSSRPGGAGRSDIYRARMNGDGPATVERLGPTVNTELSEPDVFVDPGQRYLIIARTDDPSGKGGDDLYLVMRDASGGWQAPRNLGDVVNTSEYEYGPQVSADGSTLYFTSHRGTQADLYRVRASSVGVPTRD